MPSATVTDWIIAIASATGGLGAALGGIAAWRAAQASRETAADVRRAYANSQRPALAISSFGTHEGKLGVVIKNDGDTEAVDISVTAEFTDGTTGTGWASTAGTSATTPERWWFFIGVDPSPKAESLRSGQIGSLFSKATLQFSDPERLGRWERVFEPKELTDPADDGHTTWIPQMTKDRLIETGG